MIVVRNRFIYDVYIIIILWKMSRRQKGDYNADIFAIGGKKYLLQLLFDILQKNSSIDEVSSMNYYYCSLWEFCSINFYLFNKKKRDNEKFYFLFFFFFCSDFSERFFLLIDKITNLENFSIEKLFITQVEFRKIIKINIYNRIILTFISAFLFSGRAGFKKFLNKTKAYLVFKFRVMAWEIWQKKVSTGFTLPTLWIS